MRWLADRELPDHLPAESGEPAMSARALLGAVSTSTRRLSTVEAGRLGLPDGATLGDAAAALILAVADPAGPRCRSYRAAAYYLHDLHELAVVFEDL